MRREEIFPQLLDHQSKTPVQLFGCAFAPANIALCKYWGKRNLELNLPITSSLSISLNNKGTLAKISLSSNQQHKLIINDQSLNLEAIPAKYLLSFLDEFSFLTKKAYQLELNFNIPLAAGFASSASTYAAIVKAFDDFFGWQLDKKYLSILARLGSGSACRSIFDGFVEWLCGRDPDGMDSYAQPVKETWPEFGIGLCTITNQQKSISSREGMKRTVISSALYSSWPEKVTHDLLLLKKSIAEKDFNLLGKIAESNALAMHATMLAAWPPLLYSSPNTIKCMQKIWKLRENGLVLYFTQDAGPNIKLLFLKSEEEKVKQHFPYVEIIYPFENKP
ncbi:diphosphomevalonate decarboxylase [Coxiella endosymbiont of Amblyomma nuttalli]|uniref:diphosphomevalonate decarboxylase n=1 Tax=Coxiella endosymbiont of Amblyomma nuttalli TaxID=2749996 RepID=UPI001BB661FC|nr:diphosphomevalonate decarboxylase [Coxiella endosymbiont of Amblyomma nuttalli]QTS83705.1 Mevalonate pyrophosphate decarboxylase protein [Coxiella endosymbiont of Amblyomma nuttalli]